MAPSRATAQMTGELIQFHDSLLFWQEAAHQIVY
jgi:hypothetical protein